MGSINLTPRQAYPLYYALGNVFAWLDPREPAHAMNLASAVYGALAVGLATYLAAELAGSTIAGVAAGLFLAFSYTFWSQAITAEVYTLHLFVVGAALLALVAWSRRPTLPRLALFYTAYAVGFGNHLSMILLLPGFALFILMHRPGGANDPRRPKAIVMALAIAAAGALQYAWNFAGMWSDATPPTSLSDAFAKFWFDVTKADWRETLVMGLSETGLQNRPAMYWFDLRQQFGVPGVLLASLGFGYIAARWPRRGMLLLTLYLSTLAFAWTYNVGDAYIFFLPSHYIVALCAGAGVAALMWLASLPPCPSPLTPFVGALCLLYPTWRGYDTLPAVDRSRDMRAEQVLDRMTSPISRPRWADQKLVCDTAIFGLDANWQVQNAVEYYMRQRKPDVTWFTTDDLAWLRSNPRGFSTFVYDNLEKAHRGVIITADAFRTLRALKSEESLGVTEQPTQSVLERVDSIPPGVIYALGILRPYSEYPIDAAELQNIWKGVTRAEDLPPAIGNYTIIIGRIGQPPQFVKADSRPFRVSTSIGDRQLDIRMESWLPTDTIRRSGFGHVIGDRTHLLTLERGISFLAIGEQGVPQLTEYHAGLFAPAPRYIAGSHDVVPAPCYR